MMYPVQIPTNLGVTGVGRLKCRPDTLSVYVGTGYTKTFTTTKVTPVEGGDTGDRSCGVGCWRSNGSILSPKSGSQGICGSPSTGPRHSTTDPRGRVDRVSYVLLEQTMTYLLLVHVV